MSYGFDPPRQLHRLVPAIGAVGVDHQLDVAADGFAHRAHALHVLGDRHAADLDLHRPGAHAQVLLHLLRQFLQPLAFLVVAAGDVGRHTVPEAAEQLVERQVGDLAADVPQADVDRGDRPRHQAAPAGQLRAPHLVPQPLDVDRVLADQLLRQRGDGGAPDRAAIAQADADHAFIGFNPHHGEIDMGVGVQAVGDRLACAASDIPGW